MKSRILKIAKAAVVNSMRNGSVDDSLAKGQINLLKTANSRERLSLLRAFRKLLTTKISAQTIVVESSIALSEEDKKTLQDSLQEKYGKGKKVEFSLNPSILAGLRLKAADTITDYSLSGKLSQLTEAFK